MTDLWLHVNTFFIIVLIFFRYGSHIKKYITVYFVCLFKLVFYVDGSFYFALLFLKNSLPGAVKSVPAKLCAAFLCTLLNRLRFSPQNVGFGTKRREIRPLRRKGFSAGQRPRPLSQALSGLPALPKGEPLAKPQALRVNRELYRYAKASPFGRGGSERSELTERASQLKVFPLPLYLSYLY